jgi:superfamily II DNA helicase RecQ
VRDPGTCRRRALLEAMGLATQGLEAMGPSTPGPPAPPCAGCDVCAGQAGRPAEGLAELQAFFRRHRRRFTPRQAVQVLCGRSCYEVIQHELDRYRGFGTLSGWEPEDVEEALNALQAAGELRLRRRGWWKGRFVPGRVSLAESRRPW